MFPTSIDPVHSALRLLAMPDPPRTLDQVLQDFRKAMTKFDPIGTIAGEILADIADGFALNEMPEDHQLYNKFLAYLRFMQREQHRIEEYPHMLRPIAAAEATDTPLQPEVKAHLEHNKPTRAWLELLNPFTTPPDAARVRTLRCQPFESVAWSPDSRFLATRTIIWAVETWQRLDVSDPACPEWEMLWQDLSKGSSTSPDGRFIASRGEKDYIIIWDAVILQGAGDQLLRANANSVRSVAWSPD